MNDHALLVKCELAAVGCLNNRQQHTFSQQHKQMLFLLQGDRVWLREDEQCLPSTVSSCSGGVVVFATDYGQVGVCVRVCERCEQSSAATVLPL